MGNLLNYLTEENCFDQYSVIFANSAMKTTTAIYLNSVPEPVEVASREVSFYFSQFQNYW